MWFLLQHSSCPGDKDTHQITEVTTTMALSRAGIEEGTEVTEFGLCGWGTGELPGRGRAGVLRR